MTNSYDPNRDVLDTVTPFHRPFSPARDVQTVTPSDADDLPIYGKLAVFNAGTGAETVRVVPVVSQDDLAYLDIKVPSGLTVIDWLIVRAVRATGTGADITAIVMA